MGDTSERRRCGRFCFQGDLKRREKLTGQKERGSIFPKGLVGTPTEGSGGPNQEPGPTRPVRWWRRHGYVRRECKVGT